MRFQLLLTLVSMRIIHHTPCLSTFFFFILTSPSDIYTLSLHDALPIFQTLLNLLHDVNSTVAELLGQEFTLVQTHAVLAGTRAPRTQCALYDTVIELLRGLPLGRIIRRQQH